MQYLGIQSCLFESINQCDGDIQKEMYGSIVLSGGNTLLNGFETRLQKELSKMMGEKKKAVFIAQKDGFHSAWIGGSIMASLPTFSEQCMSKYDYDEHGPSLVHKLFL